LSAEEANEELILSARNCMIDFWKALRFTLRSLGKRPGLVVVVTLCLGAGLGVNLAMFGVLDRLLWERPAGVVDPDRVLRLYATREYPAAGPITGDVFSYPAFADLQGTELGKVAAYGMSEVVLGWGLEAEKVTAGLVSPEYFPLLGVRPEAGRLLSGEEAGLESGARVVVLDHRLWRGRFGGDQQIVGREVFVAGLPHRVIGVAQPGFAGMDRRSVDLWLPLGTMSVLFGDGWHESRGSQLVHVLLRLSSEVSPGLAADQLTTRYRSAHEAAFPGSPDAGAKLSLWPLLADRGPHPSSQLKISAWTSAVAVLVLLVSLANVANLLIVRGLGRRQESAVRLALGAGSGSLVRDVLLEGVVLTLGGVLAAVPAAFAATALIDRFLLPELAGTGRLFDGRLLAFTGLLSVATGVACGFLAAVPVRRFQLTEALRAASTKRAGQRQLRHALLVGQVSLATVLLAGAGLFVRSLLEAKALDLGIEPDRLLLATIGSGGGELSTEEMEALYREARRKGEGMPGVASAAVVASLPFGTSYGIGVSIPGREELPTLPTGGPYLYAVESSFFETSGVRWIAGSPIAFENPDPVAAVSATMADLFWGGNLALGECLVVGEPDEAPCSRVVGIIEDARRQRLQEPPTMQVYVPLAQSPDWITERALLIRTTGKPGTFVEPLRREIAALRPDLPYVEVVPFAEILDGQYSSWRLGANLFSGFALVAVLLTIAGVYGVTTYTVAQQRREIGIRLALGADRRRIRRMLVTQGLRISGLGVVCGLVVAALGAPALRAQLFGVSPWDPLVYAGVVVALLLATLAATSWSARRIRDLDPVDILGTE
jgi:putative ABC transport system permease protein